MVQPYHTIRPLHSTTYGVLHFPRLARVQPPAPCCTLPHQHTPTTPCHTIPLGRRCLLDIGSSGPSGRVHRVRVGRVHPAATRPPPDRHPSTQSDVTPLVTRSSHRVTARHRRPPTSPPWHARRFSTWISRRLHGTDPGVGFTRRHDRVAGKTGAATLGARNPAKASMRPSFLRAGEAGGQVRWAGGQVRSR